MALLVDTFWDEAQRRLVPAGWVIVDGSRYDPTVINGVTPSGKSFTFECREGVVTVTVAGRSRTLARSPGESSVQALLDAYEALPRNQR